MKASHATGLLTLCALAMPVWALASPLSSADKDFLTQAGQSNQTEINLSKEALKDASSPQVKSFARTMIHDHTKLGANMKVIDPAAVEAGVNTANADTSDPFAGKTGKDFDQAYMDKMVSDHNDVADTFQKVASDASYNARIRSAVRKALPTVKHHDAMAKTLDDKLAKS